MEGARRSIVGSKRKKIKNFKSRGASMNSRRKVVAGKDRIIPSRTERQNVRGLLFPPELGESGAQNYLRNQKRVTVHCLGRGWETASGRTNRRRTLR